jgi:uncharacterized protein YjeT (DUF2065 family)
MNIVVDIIGGIWIVLGTISVLYTDGFRRSIGGFMLKFPPKVLGVVPFVMGGLLLIASPWSRSPSLLVVLGALGVLKGIFLFVLQSDKARSLLRWWQEKASEVVLRLSGLLLVILGVFLVLWI